MSNRQSLRTVAILTVRYLIFAAGLRYGGTYAHKDIAFEFATWISPQFKLYLLREFQRLKEQEQSQLSWSAKRELAKINYHIHTSAVNRNDCQGVEDCQSRTGRKYA